MFALARACPITPSPQTPEGERHRQSFAVGLNHPLEYLHRRGALELSANSRKVFEPGTVSCCTLLRASAVGTPATECPIGCALAPNAVGAHVLPTSAKTKVSMLDIPSLSY